MDSKSGSHQQTNRMHRVNRRGSVRDRTMHRCTCTRASTRAHHREGSKRVTVQEVGWLVHDKDVRVVPHRRGKDDLDFLATREALHERVRAKLGLKAKVGEVLLNGGGCKGAGHEAEAGRLLGIHFIDQLGDTKKLELLTSHPGVHFRAHVLPTHFVSEMHQYICGLGGSAMQTGEEWGFMKQRGLPVGNGMHGAQTAHDILVLC
jgi:hypothetical protein